MNFSNKKHTHLISNKNKITINILHVLYISILFTTLHLTQAQSIQSSFINYQGIARDASNEIIANQNITVDIALKFGAPTVPANYTETHNVTTDAGGVFSLKIGNGTAPSSDYYALEWRGLASYVTVSLNGTEIGTTEINAVPFALSSGDRLWYPDYGTDDIFYDVGNVGIGTSNPEEDLHVDGSVLVNSSLGRLKIGLDDNDAQWHLATLNSGQDLTFESKESGTITTNSRFTLKQNGHVGIGNTNPDEELVIGENLGSGWAVPAATIGNAIGGGLEIGNPTTNFKIAASSTFDRSRLIASDANGFGQGIIEMRTRQLNVGIDPGVGSNDYALRIVQSQPFGLDLVSSDETQDWELVTFNIGDLRLYQNDNLRGIFNADSGNYSATSDKRLKTNIKPVESVLDYISELKAKSYNYKTNLDKRFTGFLAQDVKEIFPDIVTEAEDRTGKGDSTLLIDYNQLTVIALQAIKEQQEIIDSLKARIEALENK